MGPAVCLLQDCPLSPRLPPSRYCAGTMPWGHPGEHHDFEPQRHDDGYLEVIGFTMTSLVSGRRGACLEPPFCFEGAQHSSKMEGSVTKLPFSGWALTISSSL